MLKIKNFKKYEEFMEIDKKIEEIQLQFKLFHQLCKAYQGKN